MITPRLCGRLGNQCFQISAAIAHARKMNTQWAIPRRTQDARYWPNYFLNEVALNQRTHFSSGRIYTEPRHCYDALPCFDDLTLDGYFQSEKYWPEYEDKYEIGNALGFHSNWATQEVNGSGYIAVHVRRGDYVTQFSGKHPPLEYQYYLDAMACISEKTFCHKFKFYSDDVEFCKKTFGHLSDWHFRYSTIKDPLADMRDMYNASGFIISNSTFSLFPALLRLDKPLVIAPKEERWFGPGNAHLETCDLMPERFIKI